MKLQEMTTRDVLASTKRGRGGLFGGIVPTSFAHENEEEEAAAE